MFGYLSIILINISEKVNNYLILSFSIINNLFELG